MYEILQMTFAEIFFLRYTCMTFLGSVLLHLSDQIVPRLCVLKDLIFSNCGLLFKFLCSTIYSIQIILITCTFSFRVLSVNV
jgi:hypothetical protein